jgi:hypothetical protein
VLPGIVVAVALSVLNLFRRSWLPYHAVLGRVPNLPGYHDVSSYPEAEVLPGLVMFRFDAPLFFANTRTFREQISANYEPVVMRGLVADWPAVRWPTSPHAGGSRRGDNAGDLARVRRMKDPVRAKIVSYELTRTIDPNHFYPTLDSAVAAYQEQTGAGWTRQSHEPGGPHQRRSVLSPGAVTQELTCEVRWIRPGRHGAEIARWFSRFSQVPETRDDDYLVSPRLPGLSVKIRGGASFEVKQHRGVVGALDIAAAAAGSIDSWIKRSTPLPGGADLSRPLDGSAWRRVSKRRQIATFPIEARAHRVRPSARWSSPRWTSSAKRGGRSGSRPVAGALLDASSAPRP